MKTHTHVGYAAWASHLVNGDPSGLSESEFAEMQAWLTSHGHYDYDVLGVTGDVFYAQPFGGDYVHGDCVRYIFCERE